MNKRHHPQTREERLRLKIEHEQKKALKTSHVKRRIKDSLHEAEADEELQSVRYDIHGNIVG